MITHRTISSCAALVAIALVGACRAGGSSGAPLPVPGFVDVRLDTTADTIPPEVIARGDRIFHGRLAGAVCVSCHGQDAKGTPGVAPNLTDDRWLHGDGTMAFLQRIIASGVASGSSSWISSSCRDSPAEA